eukprot:SAG11_NODE_11194_length_777_cov_1.294985_1_plen_122_part_10
MLALVATHLVPQRSTAASATAATTYADPPAGPAVGAQAEEARRIKLFEHDALASSSRAGLGAVDNAAARCYHRDGYLVVTEAFGATDLSSALDAALALARGENAAFSAAQATQGERGRNAAW